jgi:UDP-N-acetylmuramoyl-tripeptide--D-alanyl-D-alanine ligase
MEWKSILVSLGIMIQKEITGIVTDSREVKAGYLFVAINSGDQYIDEVLKKGAQVVTEKSIPNTFKTKNTIAFLGALAKAHRARLNAKVIGITGSVGKTSLSRFLAQKLPGKVVYPTGNYNNEIGLPLTVLKADMETDYLIAEMGVAKVGDMDYLGAILMPDIGVITHIGPTHLEWLKSTKGVWDEKSKLIKYAKKMVINQDAAFTELSDDILWVGVNSAVQVTTKGICVDNQFYDYDVMGIQYRMYIYACAHAVFKILHLKPNFNQINWPAMRMEIQTHSSGATIILDCYNASLLSYIAAIRYISLKKNYIIVLGEMSELGAKSVYYHELLGHILNRYRVPMVVMIGENHHATMRTFLGEVNYFEDKALLMIWLESQLSPGISVLIKGARHLALEGLL